MIETCPRTLDVTSLFTKYLSTLQVSQSHSSDVLTDAQQVLDTVHHSLSAELANSTNLSSELAISKNCLPDVRGRVESGRKGAWLDEAVCEVMEGGVCVEVGRGEGTSEVESGESGDFMTSEELEEIDHELKSRQVRCFDGDNVVCVVMATFSRRYWMKLLQRRRDPRNNMMYCW